MSILAIDVTPELEQRLQDEARKRGQRVEELARSVLEERFVDPDRHAQRERNHAAIELLDRWFAEGDAGAVDEGDPIQITPLSLREVRVE